MSIRTHYLTASEATRVAGQLVYRLGYSNVTPKSCRAYVSNLSNELEPMNAGDRRLIEFLIEQIVDDPSAYPTFRDAAKLAPDEYETPAREWELLAADYEYQYESANR